MKKTTGEILIKDDSKLQKFDSKEWADKATKKLSQELKKEWEREFDLLWGLAPEGSLKQYKGQDVKDFIKILLAKQQEKFVKMIPKYANSVDLLSIEEFGERARITNLLNENMVVGYNCAIADIKSKLNK
jgi:DNA-binding ferritin-like protein (Dps family)